MNSMKSITFLSLFAATVLAGCAGETANDVATESAGQALSTGGCTQCSTTKEDVEVLRQLTAGQAFTYTDVAASSSELYLLRSTGEIEVQPIAAPTNPNPRIISGKFDAIDYVTGYNNVWGLIAISKQTNSIYANVGLTGQQQYIGMYPEDGVDTKDIAGIADGTNSLRLYLKQQQGDVHSYYLAGQHIRPTGGAMPRVTWTPGIFGEANYTTGFTIKGSTLITTRNYAADGHMLQNIPQSATYTQEQLNGYTEHGYRIQNSMQDRFSPIGIDYTTVNGVGYYYAIDVFNGGAQPSQQLVRLASSNVVF